MSSLRGMLVPEEQVDEKQTGLTEVVREPDLQEEEINQPRVLSALERIFSQSMCYYPREGRSAREKYERQLAFTIMLDQIRFL